ncbi:MAG: hypothetical protein WKF84_28930 [Pyrinomonadaceae bacterium]
MFTMIDWRYRFGRAPFETYYLDLGLYKLNGQKGIGQQRWTALPLVKEWQQHVDDAHNSVGNIFKLESSAV